MDQAKTTEVRITLLGEPSGYPRLWERIDGIAAREGVASGPNGSLAARIYSGEIQKIGRFLFKVAERVGRENFEYAAESL